MVEEMLRAKHGDPNNPLRIGDIEIECYVLENEQRVLVSSGLSKALNLQTGQKTHPAELQAFFKKSHLKPFKIMSYPVASAKKSDSFVPVEEGVRQLALMLKSFR
ncbi:hypothetical protein SAMN05920897_12311 [Alkalispirochaeta americana]|uniref:Uncharacterized protein n=1 Tax=Alkalispirochaeta americana TaxID=159291 RepID=A0A1N6XE63_9SPIO|nr:hypothetical protein SAMN05920897_12311 [Alkalispirochaeta americana]